MSRWLLDLLPHERGDRRELAWFFLIALLVLAAGYGLREPWPADEPRFVLVSQQMVQSGDWWFPRRGHELYPDKPPLFMWLLGGAYLLIGSVRWSFLLPSLLAALATLGFTYDMGRRLWSHRAGLWAAVAVLATPAFVYQAKRAQIDPVLIGFTTLALYGLMRHLLLGPNWRWFAIGCFSAGLGVVAKGVGFLPLLALLPFGLMRWRGWRWMAPLGTGNGWRWGAGIGMFFLAIGLWFIPMLTMALTDGDPSHRAYLDNLLFKQTVTRYADAWHHHEPVWYFAEVIVLFWAPFSLTFFWLWRDWRSAWTERDARVWLPLAWALLVLAFFTGSTGKRDMYILPALPAFALAAAPYLEAWATRRGAQRVLFGYAVLLGALLLVAGKWALLADPHFATKIIEERGLGPEAAWLWGMLAMVGTVGLGAAAWWRVRGGWKAAATLLVALWLGWGLVVHPLLDDENSARGVMQKARVLAGIGTPIGLVNWKEQNLLQAQGPVVEFGFRASNATQLRRALAWMEAAPSRRLLLRPDDLPACATLNVPEAQRVGHANRRDWWLVGAASFPEGCGR